MSGQPLEPMEQIVLGVIQLHPEYHALLEDGDQALASEFTPESGQTNPFLHMGMHIAIHEQLTTDRPSGITGLYQGCLARFPDAHALEHAMMECLGEQLWRASRSGGAPDDNAYMECLKKL